MNYSQSLCPNLGKSLFCCLLFVVFAFLGTVLVYAAPGALDLSFGNAGKVLVRAGTGEFTRDIKVQPDGKIVIVGEATIAGGSNPNRDFAVLRFNSNGTPDAGFGNNGIVTTDMGSMSDLPFAVAIQPDGKIVVAGFVHSNTGQDIALARYNPDGILDSTFGNGGKVVMPLAGSDDYLFDVVIQPDGKILAAGSARKDSLTINTLIVRYNADGLPDTTFGSGGILNLQINQRSEAHAMTLQSDGKIVVAGYVINTGQDSLLLRLNSDGTFDPTFDGDGKVIIETNVSTNLFNSVKIQPDGKIVAAGFSLASINANGGFTLARFNQNGSLDNSFGNNGVIVTPMGGNYDFAQDMVIQADGRIIVLGYISDFNQTAQQSALVRYTATGMLDPSFGTSGIIKAPLSETGAPMAGQLQSDGKLLVASRADGFSVLRYQTRDTARFDFDGDGRSDVSVFRPSNGAWYLNRSTAGFTGIGFGLGTDKLAPADYDGDGKTDIAVFRDGYWYITESLTNQFRAVQFGQTGDVPVPADYDGDGKADVAVFRDGNWYFLNSSNNQFRGFQFGIPTDKPVQADYDGDGKTDVAVFRDGNWYWVNSTNNQFRAVQFGIANDRPVPADYDGDGKSDQAVYRSGIWYLQRSSSGFTGIQFGNPTDTPVAADYDGDGKADIAVFRAGNWYRLNSTNNQFIAEQFGTDTDKPVESAFMH
jgi:uncharacterized delta-60 repeat protein